MSGHIHIEGGNWFDDMRIDLSAAYLEQDERLLLRRPRSVRRSRLRNAAARWLLNAEEKLGIRETAVMTGIRRKWFDEFHEYWCSALAGRQLTIADFHGLRFQYRRMAQMTTGLEWATTEQHLANWATPENLAATFQFVYRSALRPVRSPLLTKVLPHNGRVLEYGCSLAPMYRMWRSFHSNVACDWLLADIPTFPFHYARHAYAGDAEAQFHVIRDFKNPLGGVEGDFDLIIVQEVFEHLDSPRWIAEYLLERLSPGGLFMFDYIATEDALGHDTPAGVTERIETLAYLHSELEIEFGQMYVGDEPVSLCVGRRR